MLIQVEEHEQDQPTTKDEDEQMKDHDIIEQIEKWIESIDMEMEQEPPPRVA